MNGYQLKEIHVSDWIDYPHGRWRRVGRYAEIVTPSRIMPRGLIPDYEYMATFKTPYNPFIQMDCRKAGTFVIYTMSVPIKGWSDSFPTNGLKHDNAHGPCSCGAWHNCEHDFSKGPICENCGRDAM